MMTAQEELDKNFNYYWQRIRAFGESHKHFDWIAMEVLLNSNFTYNLLDSVLSHKTREHGLSRAALNVLSILDRSEGKKGCKHYEISKLLLVSRANITGLIDGLIRQGLVERVYDENDRRICIARISKKGEELVASFLPKYYEYATALFSNLSNKEKQQLNALLVKMRSSINDRLKKLKNEKSEPKTTKRNT